MAKAKVVKESNAPRRTRPGLTPEARENQMVCLAIDLAEKQLMDGTASSQVITHYLKLGSPTERLKREILEKEKDLIEAKTQNLQSSQRIEELYKNAMDAFRSYRGEGDPDEYQDVF